MLLLYRNKISQDTDRSVLFIHLIKRNGLNQTQMGKNDAESSFLLRTLPHLLLFKLIYMRYFHTDLYSAEITQPPDLMKE